jgi:hypothetical protein
MDDSILDGLLGRGGEDRPEQVQGPIPLDRDL